MTDMGVPHVCFHGDDFTGLSENLAQNHRHGLRCLLFFDSSSIDQIRNHLPDLDVVPFPRAVKEIIQSSYLPGHKGLLVALDVFKVGIDCVLTGKKSPKESIDYMVQTLKDKGVIEQAGHVGQERPARFATTLSPIYMTRVLIIADDLSGAADCAMGFAMAGLTTSVVLDPDVDASAEVVAVTTETRHVPPEQAAFLVACATRRMFTGSERVVYKKIDSTLRGHVAAETAAMRAMLISSRDGTLPAPVSIVAPAFPGTGRTTLGGHQYVKGVPLERTEMGRGKDVVHGSIPRLLQSAVPSLTQVGIDAVRRGPEALCEVFGACLSAGFDTLVCDAEDTEDLRSIAVAGNLLGRPVLWVGSGGLARALAVTLTAARTRRPAAPETLATRGSILSVVGSRSEIARAQVRALAGSGAAQELRVPIAALGEQDTGSRRWNDVQHALSSLLDGKKNVVLSLDGQGCEPPWSQDPHLCSSLARMVAPLNAKIGALILTGGDTARAVLEELGVRQLHLLREVEPGVTLAQSGEGARCRPIVLKAGAFGDERTLIHCHEFLAMESRCPARSLR